MAAYPCRWSDGTVGTLGTDGTVGTLGTDVTVATVGTLGTDGTVVMDVPCDLQNPKIEPNIKSFLYGFPSLMTIL
jgi:hypothetical protein